MTNFFNLLLITLAVVHLIDLSGFIQTIKRTILKLLGRPPQDFSLKPFDCSYCMTHHISVIYLLCIHQLTLINYVIILSLSFITPVIKDLMIYLKDLLTAFVDWIYTKTIS